jgi:hypothetical protein
MDVMKIGYEGMDGIQLAQDRVQWLAVVLCIGFLERRGLS